MNKDIEFSNQVKALKLKTNTGYIAYCLVELVNGFKVKRSTPNETIVYQPFQTISGSYKTESDIRIVTGAEYYHQCTCINNSEFNKDRSHTSIILKNLIARLSEMGLMSKLAVYKTMFNNSGSISPLSQYLLGPEYIGELDKDIIDTPLFLFTTRSFAL